MAKSKLLQIAKNKTTKNTEQKEILTPEKERELKAKETVEKLLNDVSLTKKSVEVKIETKKEGVDWLEEEVSKLSVENEKLRKELAGLSELLSVKGIANNKDDSLKQSVVKLFNEIQDNYFKVGKNPHTGQTNLIIPPVAFMNRLILFFPFLENEKRY